MKLIDLLRDLQNLDDDLTIYAASDPDWTPTSEAVVAWEPEDGRLPPEAAGMKYLLEVHLAKEAIDVWQEWRSGRRPTPGEQCDAVIYYAKNDSYEPT